MHCRLPIWRRSHLFTRSGQNSLNFKKKKGNVDDHTSWSPSQAPGTLLSASTSLSYFMITKPCELGVIICILPMGGSWGSWRSGNISRVTRLIKGRIQRQHWYVQCPYLLKTGKCSSFQLCNPQNSTGTSQQLFLSRRALTCILKSHNLSSGEPGPCFLLFSFLSACFRLPCGKSSTQHGGR